MESSKTVQYAMVIQNPFVLGSCYSHSNFYRFFVGKVDIKSHVSLYHDHLKQGLERIYINMFIYIQKCVYIYINIYICIYDSTRLNKYVYKLKKSPYFIALTTE